MTTRPVTDRTGPQGSFDFVIDLSPYIVDPPAGGPIDSEGATLRALPDQPGLALNADKGRFDVLVVDRVD